MPDFPFLVIVTPNPGSDPDSLKCTAAHDNTHLGRLPRGFVCYAKREYLGKYELAPYKTPWPWSPIGWGSVYADKDFLPAYTGETKPVTGDATWQDVLRAVAKAVLEVLGE